MWYVTSEAFQEVLQEKVGQRCHFLLAHLPGMPWKLCNMMVRASSVFKKDFMNSMFLLKWSTSNQTIVQKLLVEILKIIPKTVDWKLEIIAAYSSCYDLFVILILKNILYTIFSIFSILLRVGEWKGELYVAGAVLFRIDK